MVNAYQTIVVGDVSAPQSAKTRMAKSVLDAGWGMLKTLLHTKASRPADASHRQRKKHDANMQQLRGPHGPHRSGHARCKDLDLQRVRCDSR